MRPPTERTLRSLLADGETLVWSGRPDALSAFLAARWFLWIGVPWAIAAAWLGGFEGFGVPLFLVGFALAAAPFLMAASTWFTLYAITNRRTLILTSFIGGSEQISTPFADMDEVFDILDTGRGAGIVNFASGSSTRLSATDHTGRLGFRYVPRPREVAVLLEMARTRARSGRPQAGQDPAGRVHMPQ